MNLSTLMNQDADESATGAQPEIAAATQSTDESEDGGLVASERKPVNSTALTLFFIIVLGVAGTYFMHLRTGPQSAAAAGVDLNAAATVTGFLTDGRRALNQMRLLLNGTQKVVDQFRNYPSVAQVPLTELKANPFHLATAQAIQVEDAAEVARKRKEVERQAVLQGAQALQVQSLMRTGAKRVAMINNVMCQEGDSVGGFLIEKITANSVIVKQTGYRFEVRLSQ